MSDSSDDGDRRICVDCKRVSPKVQTGYTLISQTHGWRLGRRKVDDGYVMEWRCPTCWAKQRDAAPKAASKRQD
jgi:hypothetical protein